MWRGKTRTLDSMRERFAAWALMLVAVVQALNLWPLPEAAAASEIAVWSKLKADWEATDPAKSETPAWSAKAKSEGLARVNEVLANPAAVLYRARIHWGLWLSCVLVSLIAAVLAFRSSRHWQLPALLSLPLFLWLQQPWYMFRPFFSEGAFDLEGGIRQLGFIARDFLASLVRMLALNVVVPLALLVVAIYAAFHMARRSRHAL